MAGKPKKIVVSEASKYKTHKIGEVEREITYMCPIRGLVTEKIVGNVYAPVKYIESINKEDLDVSMLIKSGEIDDDEII